MSSALRQFWQRHPSVRDAVRWALPALLFAFVLRALLLSYSPYAYWGSDSRSYYDFTYKLYTEHYFSLVEKRRFLYPIFVAIVNALPGSTLRWLALIQHAFGILTLIPIAYAIRKTCLHWRWWIIPVTLIYAGMPVLFWYEHELLAETLLFNTAAWAFAGWIAWASEESRARAARLWWCFLLPFACLILIKPSARFFWPGVGLGLLYLCAWRKVSRAGLIAGLALMVATLFVGSKKQGAWLMYTATFPLTQLDTPLHAEYKAQIADDVHKYRDRIDHYYREDEWAFNFLENPSKQTERPLWHALEGQTNAKPKLYMDLALEGIKANPGLFLMMGRDRLVVSANFSEFKEVRFTSSYYPDKFANDYHHAEEAVAAGQASYEAMALGLPRKGPLPPYSEIRERLSPRPGGLGERLVNDWVAGFKKWADLVRWPEGRERSMTGDLARPTLLGWYLLAAIACSFATTRLRRTHAVWALSALSYLTGVFLLTQVNPRYFGAVWPIFIPLLAVPADLVVELLTRRFRRPVNEAVPAPTK